MADMEIGVKLLLLLMGERARPGLLGELIHPTQIGVPKAEGEKVAGKVRRQSIGLGLNDSFEDCVLDVHAYMIARLVRGKRLMGPMRNRACAE